MPQTYFCEDLLPSHLLVMRRIALHVHWGRFRENRKKWKSSENPTSSTATNTMPNSPNSRTQRTQRTQRTHTMKCSFVSCAIVDGKVFLSCIPIWMHLAFGFHKFLVENTVYSWVLPAHGIVVCTQLSARCCPFSICVDFCWFNVRGTRAIIENFVETCILNSGAQTLLSPANTTVHTPAHIALIQYNTCIRNAIRPHSAPN